MSRPSAPSRYLSVWFDRLSIDRARRRAPSLGSPLALVGKQANALRVEALDPAGLAAGLVPGMTLADARAQLPELKTADADPGADRRALKALAKACRRYTPSLALDPPDGLMLNVTGAARLFGGEAALAADLVARMAALGVSVRWGLADTAALAWGLARFGEGARLAPQGRTAGPLAGLPVAALRLEEDTVSILHGLGLRRVGQLMAARARPAIARRLGEGVLHRLDQATGDRADALRLRLEVAPWRVERRLAEPVATEDQVLAVVSDLARALGERLEGAGLGGHLFRLELFRVDGVVRALSVTASQPLCDPRRVAALFAERLDTLGSGLEADFGFDLIRLWVRRARPVSSEAADLLGAQAEAAAFAGLVDRLSARLGSGLVRRPVPARETRVPERAVRAIPVQGEAEPVWTAPAPVDEGVPLRPATLFAAPEPIEILAEVPEGAPDRFRWRKVWRRVAAAEGPERLEPEWGRATALPRVRDYYRLEDEAGERFWVFREGRYGERPEPRWFMHGVLP
jgi:protein ImuB